MTPIDPFGSNNESRTKKIKGKTVSDPAYFQVTYVFGVQKS